MTKVPSYIEKLDAYVPGKSIEELKRKMGQKNIIKLASNENPIGPSPKALKAVFQALGSLHRYPDDGLPLKTAIAERFQIRPENVILSNGSDSLILAVTRAFVTEGGEVVTSEATFPQYLLMPASRGATVKCAPMKEYRYDLSAIVKLITPKTQVIFLANPNNPTGTIFTVKEWDDFYSKVSKEILIVCDEAYAELVFGNPDWPDSMKYRYDNVITLRTFSKAYGLAGIRLGYGMGHEEIIRTLHKVKLPFEPSALAQAAGLGALQDDQCVREFVALIESGRAYFYERLQKMKIRFVPSAVNFVMVDFGSADAAKKVFHGLLKEGVIIRPLDSCGLPTYARITIGLPEENKRCLDVIEKYCS